MVMVKNLISLFSILSASRCKSKSTLAQAKPQMNEVLLLLSEQ
jgi:hypothetical protein